MLCLPDYVEYQIVPAPSLRSLFPTVSEDALDLLSKMFTYDPKSRISIQQALQHRYFTCAPSPTDPLKLARPIRKQDAKSSDSSKLKTVKKTLSPAHKLRRVIADRGKSGNGLKDQSVDVMKQASHDGQAPMSLDFTILAERPPNRPTITR